MHKDFYASGFLYHGPTEQILLQQKTKTQDSSPGWSLFGGMGTSKHNPQLIFQRIVNKLLKIKLKTNVIEPVYVYFNKDMDKDHHIVYATIKTPKKFSPKNGVIFSWFTFRQVIKLKLDEQTKHDIVVAQRVIASKTRKRLGQHTLE